MGKIKFDFYKNPNIKSENSKSEYHIRICDRQTIGTKGIVENIHMKSTLTSVDINAVIIAFQDEIANQLGQGKIVRLEGLCSFDISLKPKSGICTGEESSKEIELKSVNINPEKEFMERVQKCINETGMEKVTGKHSVTIPDEKVDSLLTEYFKKEKNGSFSAKRGPLRSQMSRIEKALGIIMEIRQDGVDITRPEHSI